MTETRYIPGHVVSDGLMLVYPRGTTEEQIQDHNLKPYRYTGIVINHYQTRFHYLNGKLHRVNGPAVWNPKNKALFSYYRHGRLRRANGVAHSDPADKLGNPEIQLNFKDGKIYNATTRHRRMQRSHTSHAQKSSIK